MLLIACYTRSHYKYKPKAEIHKIDSRPAIYMTNLNVVMNNAESGLIFRAYERKANVALSRKNTADPYRNLGKI